MQARQLTAAVFTALLVTAGCSDRTKQEAREAGQEAGKAAQAAGEAVESAADDAVRNAERAGDTVQQASRQAGDVPDSLKQAGRNARETANDAAAATGAAVQTAQVKAALIADSKVDAAGINVDTDAASKTITLKGHVPSATQKTAAGLIAEAKAATGYHVRNELVVHP